MPMLADSLRNLASSLIVAAIIVAALVLGQDILVPISLAIVLSFILAPIVRALTRFGLPHSASVSLSLITAVTMVGASIFVFSNQLLNLAQNLDDYKPNIVNKVRDIAGSGTQQNALQRAAVAIDKLQTDVLREMDEPTVSAPQGSGQAPDANPARAVAPPSDSDGKFAALKELAAAVGAPIGKALLAILFTFFLLLQHSDLRDRVIRVAGTDNMSSATAALAEAGTRLSTLFLAQAAINTAFGIFVGIALWAIGVPNPVLWGIVAAVMRFVPFVGSILAALPPLLLAAGVEPGWSMFLATLMLFAIGEPMMGHVVEPLVLGKRAGLSPFAIVIALSVWTLLWGPIGLLLAVPITLAIVVLGRYVPGMEFLSVLLGDEPALTPAQSFYNRLLSKDASAAIAQIQDANAEGSIMATTDEIVLPALQLASTDYALDRLDDKQLEEMQTTMSLVSAAFADAGGLEDTAAASKYATSILVVPARGRVDKMAAEFLATLLNSFTPYRVRATGASGLTALADSKATLERGDDKPGIVIASTGASDSAQLRLIVSRAASTFPHTPVFVAGLGFAENTSKARREDAGTTAAQWTKFGQLIELIRSRHPAEAKPDATAPPPATRAVRPPHPATA